MSADYDDEDGLDSPVLRTYQITRNGRPWYEPVKGSLAAMVVYMAAKGWGGQIEITRLDEKGSELKGA